MSKQYQSRSVLLAENAELRRRVANAYDDVVLAPTDPRHAGRLDPRIEAAQIAAREARTALMDIAKATWGENLLDISSRLAKSHDGLYKVNKELSMLRAATALSDKPTGAPSFTGDATP